MLTKINGVKTDVGLYEHVFDGTDEQYDEMLKNEKLLKLIKIEMQKIGIIKENLDETLKMIADEFALEDEDI